MDRQLSQVVGLTIESTVILTIKTVADLRNVGDAAYATSHAAAEAYTVHTSAGYRTWH